MTIQQLKAKTAFKVLVYETNNRPTEYVVEKQADGTYRVAATHGKHAGPYLVRQLPGGGFHCQLQAGDACKGYLANVRHGLKWCRHIGALLDVRAMVNQWAADIKAEQEQQLAAKVTSIMAEYDAATEPALAAEAPCLTCLGKRGYFDARGEYVGCCVCNPSTDPKERRDALGARSQELRVAARCHRAGTPELASLHAELEVVGRAYLRATKEYNDFLDQQKVIAAGRRNSAELFDSVAPSPRSRVPMLAPDDFDPFVRAAV